MNQIIINVYHEVQILLMKVLTAALYSLSKYLLNSHYLQ
jgi:hypothetical protein